MAAATETVTGPVSKYDRGTDEVRAEFSEFKNRKYFGIRVWWADSKAGGEMKPGKNGINLPVDEKPEFLRLVVALFPDDIQLIKQGEE